MMTSHSHLGLGLLGLAWIASACGPGDASEDLPPGAFTSGPVLDTFDDLGISASDDEADGGDGTMDETADGGGMTDEGSTGDAPCVVPEGLSHAADIAPIWVNSCAVAATCHVAGGSQAPDLETDPYTTLLNESSALVGADWIVASDTEQSYVYLKITNRHAEAGGQGGPMPLSPGVLTSCESMIIEAWINEGAQP